MSSFINSRNHSSKASLKPFFHKGGADGITELKRHNKFTVRSKFRIFETCSTDYIPLLGTARYLLCNFALRKIKADGETDYVFRIMFHRPPPFGILILSYILIF